MGFLAKFGSSPGIFPKNFKKPKTCQNAKIPLFIPDNITKLTNLKIFNIDDNKIITSQQGIQFLLQRGVKIERDNQEQHKTPKEMPNLQEIFNDLKEEDLGLNGEENSGDPEEENFENMRTNIRNSRISVDRSIQRSNMSEFENLARGGSQNLNHTAIGIGGRSNTMEGIRAH